MNIEPSEQRLRELRQNYPKGSAAPTGYIDWHNWAEAQDSFGLKQQRCKRCHLYFFPQEAPSHMTCEKK